MDGEDAQTVRTADLRTSFVRIWHQNSAGRLLFLGFSLRTYPLWFLSVIVFYQRTRVMLSSLKTLLLLSVLCAPTSSLCRRLYQTRSNLLCGDLMAVRVPSDENEPGYSPVDSWGSILQSEEYLSPSSSTSSAESSREKRTSSPANYRFMSRTKLRGQMLRNSIKGDRRSRLTLSLDVPTNIMNVLFDVAKAKNLRAKAAENARLMAQIGRRK